MVITVKPTKFKLYTNTSKKTASQVRKETGADIVVNCWLYDMKTFKAVCDVKVDGKVLSNDKYTYWGYGFNKNDKRMIMSNDMSKWDNYFAVVGMLMNGKKLDMYIDSGMGGSRPRSSIGFKANGEMVIYCTTSNISIPKVQETMIAQGCVDAMVLDGGGSVQIASDYGNINSARRVHGFVCIWIEKDKNAKCPHSEPILNIKNGSRGNGAKWVQWHLNRHGANLTVDGIFGANSVKALKEFQNKHGLEVDGICGKQTREELKK